MRKTVFILALFMTGELLAVPFAPLLALPLVPLMKPLTASRAAERVLAVLFLPAAALTAASVSVRLARFIGAASLPKTPVWLIAAVTAAAALFLALGGPEGVGKFAAFALPLAAGFSALAAILLAGKMRAGGFSVPPVWERNPAVLACEGVTLLGLMPALRYKEKPFRAYLTALATACALGAAVWLLSVFTLGGEAVKSVLYPFHTALRVAKGGELIGRIEAFLVPVLLCAAAVKAAACVTVIARGIRVYIPPSSAMASKVRLPETAPET